MLSGYKTFITGIVAIVGAVGGMLTGGISVEAGIQLIVTALIGMFIRAGIPPAQGN